MDSIGERLKYLRNKSNLTQQDLANITGIPRANISNYEKNRYKPASSVLNTFVNYFGVSKEWILNGDGPVPVTIKNASNDPYKERFKELGDLQHNDGTKVNARDKRKILQLLDGTLGDLMFNQADVYEEFNDEDMELLRQSLISTYLDIRDIKRKEKLKKAKEQKEKLDAEIEYLEKVLDIKGKDDTEE